MRVIHKRVTLAAAAATAFSVIAATGVAVAPLAEAQPQAFSTVTRVASTVPGNGDLNPYGVAIVPRSQGKLHKGDVLVSNFNNKANQQGTGTTIVEVTPRGKTSLFAQINRARLPGACPGGVGLTTALAILNHGWVVVGSLPTTAGNPATSKAGCLLVINSSGKVVETFAGKGINGPWDMTAAGSGRVANLFVTNVLNGTVAAKGKVVHKGTVLRLLVTTPRSGLPKLLTATTIASGFPERTDPAALVIGPTGVGLGAHGTLYVADTLNNRIAAIPDAMFRAGSAGTGRTLTRNGALKGPLGLAIAFGGNILSVNSGDGNLVVTTPSGKQAAVKTLDTSGSPPGAGALFGLAVAPRGVYFVDDSTNTLNLLS
jgi:sugar lactone lactonase YvrE